MKHITFTNVNSESAKYFEQVELYNKMISSELHDTSLQTLAYLINQIDIAKLYIDKDTTVAKELLDKSRVELKKVIDELRGTISILRPMQLDDLSFSEALEHLILEYNVKTDIKINSKIEDIDISNKEYSCSLYKVVSECIVNSIKHSDADNIYIYLRYKDGNLLLQYKDDGIGFNYNLVMKDRHYGLQILKDRIVSMGGSVEYYSFDDSGRGISIDITIPATCN